MTQTEGFTSKFKKYDRLIKHASYRFRMDGVVEAQDLYQEGLMILNNMFSQKFDPDSIDFDKMFKTELWHGLAKILSKRKAAKRGIKYMAMTRDIASLDEDFTHHGTINPGFKDEYARDQEVYIEQTTDYVNAERAILERESTHDVDHFIDELTYRLDDEAKVVLLELLVPRDWKDIPGEHWVNKEGDSFERLPSKIPQPVIAQVLGIPLTRLRRAITRIRKAAIQLHNDFGFDFYHGTSPRLS